MIQNKNLKKYIAVIFAGVYLFAFLVASNLHNHNGGYFYKDFNFKNSESSFSKQSIVKNGDDCLSCHFASASVILPEVVQFNHLYKIFITTSKVFACSQKTTVPHFTFLLRGPPNFI